MFFLVFICVIWYVHFTSGAQVLFTNWLACDCPVLVLNDMFGLLLTLFGLLLACNCPECVHWNVNCTAQCANMLYILYSIHPIPQHLAKIPFSVLSSTGVLQPCDGPEFILGSTDEAPPWLRPGFTAPDGSYVRHWSSIYASGHLWSSGLDSGDSAQQGRHPRLVWVEPGAAMLLLLCCYAALPLRQRRNYLNIIFSISLQYNISYLKISMPWGLNLGPLIRNSYCYPLHYWHICSVNDFGDVKK